MFYVFWTCPNCHRTHRYVWDDHEVDTFEVGGLIQMECDNDVLGAGCGAKTEMEFVHISDTIEWDDHEMENGYCVVMSPEQIFG